MGRGDKKTKKGKMFMGSYGVSRPKNPSTTTSATKAPVAANEANSKSDIENEAPKVTAKPKAAPKPKL